MVQSGQSRSDIVGWLRPVRFAVISQLEAGLNAVPRLALQQLYLVLLQRLRNSLPECRQAHGVLVPPGLHKRLVYECVLMHILLINIYFNLCIVMPYTH